MKKSLFILLFSLPLVLSGCNNSDSQAVPDSPNTPDTNLSEPITDDQADAIEALNEFYAKNLKTVYYQGGEGLGQEPKLMELEGADASTFDIFAPLENIYFAKDKNHVYRQEEKLEGIDGGSFEFLMGANKKPLYAKDDKAVYILYEDMLSGKGSLLNFEKLADADPATFEFSEHDNCASTSALYAHDDVRAYFGSGKIESADGKSFEHLAYSFAKDNNRVYFLGEPIEADVASFEALYEEGEAPSCTEMYAKDKDHVYKCFNECAVVQEADPKTFVAPKK